MRFARVVDGEGVWNGWVQVTLQSTLVADLNNCEAVEVSILSALSMC